MGWSRTKKITFFVGVVAAVIVGATVAFLLARPEREEILASHLKEAQEFTSQRDWDKAIAEYERAIQIDKGYAPAWCELGIAWMEKGDFEAAIPKLKKAVSLNPNYPKAHYALAVSYLRSPDPDLELARRHYELSQSLGFVAPEWFERYLKRLETR